MAGRPPRDFLGVEKKTKFLLDADDPRCKRASLHELGLEAYPRLFENVPPDHGFRHLLDATPHYFAQKTPLTHIPDLARAPVIFLLREPVSRLLSSFHFRKAEGRVPVNQSFVAYAEAEAALVRARRRWPFATDSAWPSLHYAPVLRVWRDALGPEHMAVMLIEELEPDPRPMLRAYAERASIDPRVYDGYAFNRRRTTNHVARHGLHLALLALKEGNRWAFEAPHPLKPLYQRLNTRSGPPPLGAAAEAAPARMRAAAAYDDDLAELLGRDLPWRRASGSAARPG